MRELRLETTEVRVELKKVLRADFFTEDTATQGRQNATTALPIEHSRLNQAYRKLPTLSEVVADCLQQL